MTQKETHNGWTNYATWRVNLEIVDGTTWNSDDTTFEDIHSLKEYIKDFVETCVLEQGDSKQSLLLDYATAFLSDVNYYEIAQSVAESNPSLITGKDTQDGELLINQD